MREHFPMQTIEDVISRTTNAKVFIVHTPLPFGIASAPEVFQNIMSLLFDDIEGVKVIVDDLVREN